MYLTLLKGFTTGGSLIVAIGAQNAFVIRQGLMKRHLFLTAFLCSFIDSVLITFGVLGFGEMISAYPNLMIASKYFACLFLFIYGALSLKSAFKDKALQDSTEATSWKQTLVLLLAFSLLNPHVYLDTVLLLGCIACQHPEHEKIYFAVGAISASFIWFFSLTYGSRLFAPYLKNPIAWKIIDTVVAITMWAIAIALLNL